MSATARRDDVDVAAVRDAVRNIAESPRYDDWLLEMPDHVLHAVAAPLEMLVFQYYLTPQKERMLLRAARVVWDSVADFLGDCPADMAIDYAALGTALSPRADQ